MKSTDIGLILHQTIICQIIASGAKRPWWVGQSAHNWALCPHTIGDFPLVENLQN